VVPGQPAIVAYPSRPTRSPADIRVEGAADHIVQAGRDELNIPPSTKACPTDE
jgi:hypothetical protein